MDIILKQYEEEMKHTIKKLKIEISKIQTNLNNSSLLKTINIEYYGNSTPISQLSQIRFEEGKRIIIKPYERKLISEIIKQISKADIGLTPQNNGDTVFINIPPLTEESRKLKVKQLNSIIEHFKVAIRNIRRLANTEIKKDKSLSLNQVDILHNEIQQLTNKQMQVINEILLKKEKEIITI